jgi:type I restriction enzyme M protein
MGYQDRELRKELEKLIPAESLPAPPAVILGLVFLRYICAAATEHNAKTAASRGRENSGVEGEESAGPDTDRERPLGGLFVPSSLHWDHIFPREAPDGENPGEASLREIAAAIRSLERENPALRDLFPSDLKRPPGRFTGPPSPEGGALFPEDLGRFLGDLSSREAARAFRFLSEKFEKIPDPLDGLKASAVRRERFRKTCSPEIPVPRSIVELAVHMLEPYQGRFYDPCCGSAAFLTGAADFLSLRQGKLSDLSFYAQERGVEAWRRAFMNLLVRGVDTTEILLTHDSPLQRDRHRDLRFDFISACPPFEENPYLWIQYVLDRLSPSGLGAIVLPKHSLASSREGDREIRRALVEGRILDCVVNLPPRIFGALNPCIWLLSRAKAGRGRRSDELLFIDARQLGRSRDRRHWELSEEDINRIARTYHNWRFPKAAPYRDIRQFAVSVSLAQIREARYDLNPAFYLGIPETGVAQGGRFAALCAEFEELVREDSRLSRQLVENLRKIKVED